jgi:hypothetical protein
MELSDIIIIILLMSSFTLWMINVNKKCSIDKKPPIIIYKTRPELDLQFDSSNFPSIVYEKMFNYPNIWQGGYNLDSSKTINKVKLK